MLYKIPDSLTWDRIAAAWETAEERFARLDQVLIESDLRDAWMARAHFDIGAASTERTPVEKWH